MFHDKGICAVSLTETKLSDLITPEQIIDLEPVGKREVLEHLCAHMARDGRVLDGEALLQAMIKREEQVSTGVGMGIAIPHVKIPQVTDYIMTVGRIKQGMDFKALDGRPVYLVFMIGASDRQTKEFVKLLARVTHLLKSESVRNTLLETPIPDGFLDVIRANER